METAPPKKWKSTPPPKNGNLQPGFRKQTPITTSFLSFHQRSRMLKKKSGMTARAINRGIGLGLRSLLAPELTQKPPWFRPFTWVSLSLTLRIKWIFLLTFQAKTVTTRGNKNYIVKQLVKKIRQQNQCSWGNLSLEAERSLFTSVKCRPKSFSIHIHGY